jgi:hypothetical protein
VSFIGADPVKRPEIQNLIDRYRERITLNNNGVVQYSKLFRGGFSTKFTDAEMIEAIVAQPGYKDRGIIFDRLPPNAPATTLSSSATPINAVSAPPASPKEPSARLKQLEDAYRQNLLTPAEYQAKRKAILDSM